MAVPAPWPGPNVLGFEFMDGVERRQQSVARAVSVAAAVLSPHEVYQFPHLVAECADEGYAKLRIVLVMGVPLPGEHDDILWLPLRELSGSPLYTWAALGLQSLETMVERELKASPARSQGHEGRTERDHEYWKTMFTYCSKVNQVLIDELRNVPDDDEFATFFRETAEQVGQNAPKMEDIGEQLTRAPQPPPDVEHVAFKEKILPPLTLRYPLPRPQVEPERDFYYVEDLYSDEAKTEIKEWLQEFAKDPLKKIDAPISRRKRCTRWQEGESLICATTNPVIGYRFSILKPESRAI